MVPRAAAARKLVQNEGLGPLPDLLHLKLWSQGVEGGSRLILMSPLGNPSAAGLPEPLFYRKPTATITFNEGMLKPLS